jgi:hypothetical protein
MADLNISKLSVSTEMPFQLVKAATESCVVYDYESCIFHVNVTANNGEEIEVNVVCKFIYDPTVENVNMINVSMDGQNMTVNVNLINWNNDYYTISNRVKIFSYCSNTVYIEFIVNSIGLINDNSYAEGRKRHVVLNVYIQPTEMEKLMKEHDDQKKAAAIAKALEEKTKEELDKLKDNQANGFGLDALAGMMGAMAGNMAMGAMGNPPLDENGNPVLPPSHEEPIDSEAKVIEDETNTNDDK